jgi:hypothetical protein
MKQLIVLSGRANVGKSRTIKRVYELLQSKHPNLKFIVPLSPRLRTETYVVLKINKIIIGIASRGDNRRCIEEALPLFFNPHKCKIILCATRTKGGSWDAVQEFSENNGYEINRIIKTPAEPKVKTQSKSNEQYANDIVKLIEDFMCSGK